ncbi:MAG: HAMP domain-containing protein [Chloroflexi bacterium]|nr:HAMP domain-containing protein [Chloroflexota bacterium]
MLAWFQGLSVRYQVAIGMALGVALATLAFGLIMSYVLQQDIGKAKERRLNQALSIASRLDSVILSSGSDPGVLQDALSLSVPQGDVFSAFIDERGAVLATSSDGGALLAEGQSAIFEELARLRRASVRMLRISGTIRIVAFAPLREAAGGVVVEDAGESTLSGPFQLLRILPLFGLGILVLASLGVWLHSHYVLSPLTKLEKAVADVARGKLDEPFSTSRRDEIGLLARSFDSMRAQLKVASQARDWWEGQLKQRVAERTAEVHRLMARVIRAQEEERRRLSQELHDDTAQALASLLMGIEALRDSLPPSQERLRQHIERTVADGRRALEDLRRVIAGLRPAAVDNMGLVAALRSYAGARLGPAGVRMDFVVRGTEQRLPEAVEAALFRILQEAVNNAARHAKAKSAHIEFDFQDGLLTASVEDDGGGFEPSDVRGGGRGMGLEGMRERADLINARLEVTSSPGKGTRVKVEFPLAERPEWAG